MTRRNLSSLAALDSLGAVFTAADVVAKFGWAKDYAATALYRWGQVNLIKPLGGRSEVYFNLRNDTNWQQHWPEAVKLAVPSAIQVGEPVLQRAGWITQLPYKTPIAYLKGAKRYALDGGVMLPRPPIWYKAVTDGVDRTHFLPSLTPHWALAEMLFSADQRTIELDDLYLDEADKPAGRTEFAKAAHAIGELHGLYISFDLEMTLTEMYEDACELTADLQIKQSRMACSG